MKKTLCYGVLAAALVARTGWTEDEPAGAPEDVGPSEVEVEIEDVAVEELEIDVPEVEELEIDAPEIEIDVPADEVVYEATILPDFEGPHILGGPVWGGRPDWAGKPEWNTEADGEIVTFGGPMIYTLNTAGPRGDVLPITRGHAGEAPGLANAELRHESIRNRLQLAAEERGLARATLETPAEEAKGGFIGRLMRREPEAVTDADRDLATNLAAVDQMRDRALVTGDAALLQKADELEARLRARPNPLRRLFGNR